jgi:NADH:ubiquinone oxidoreductase subunit 6 (subunit J)
MIFAEYLLPFELAGMTLLLCLIGAAYLVRRREH